MQRFPAHINLHKIIAFCMSLLFLQALVADIMHVDRVQHAYCPAHQEVTHDIEHVNAVHANRLANHGNAGQLVDHGGDLTVPEHEPLNRDHKDSPFDCGELIWLAADIQAVFSPAFEFALRAPPLVSLPAAKSVQTQSDSFPAIALHFHASGLSPPVFS